MWKLWLYDMWLNKYFSESEFSESNAKGKDKGNVHFLILSLGGTDLVFTTKWIWALEVLSSLLDFRHLFWWWWKQWKSSTFFLIPGASLNIMWINVSPIKTSALLEPFAESRGGHLASESIPVHKNHGKGCAFQHQTGYHADLCLGYELVLFSG